MHKFVNDVMSPVILTILEILGDLGEWSRFFSPRSLITEDLLT